MITLKGDKPLEERIKFPRVFYGDIFIFLLNISHVIIIAL